MITLKIIFKALNINYISVIYTIYTKLTNFFTLLDFEIMVKYKELFNYFQKINLLKKLPSRF